MDSALHSIVKGLCAPGRIIAFCDETDLTLTPTSTLVGELHLYGGVILRSETYSLLSQNLTGYLADIGQVEFHANEIVNPNSKSRWKALDYGARVEALRHVCSVIADSNAIFVYARICKAQYTELLEATGGAAEGINYKAAVKQVFLRSVAEYLVGTTPAVVVIDRDKNTPGPSPVKFQGSASLIGGAAISVNSEEVIGLQIADIVAYVIGRFLRRRDRIAPADPEHYEAFDRVVMEFLGHMHGRLHEVLKPLPTLGQVV
jgi:hypothetical protein